MIVSNSPSNPPGQHTGLSGPATLPHRPGCCFTSNPSNPHGGVSGSRQFSLFYYYLESDTTGFWLDVLDTVIEGFENGQCTPPTTTILRPGGAEIAFGGLDIAEGNDD